MVGNKQYRRQLIKGGNSMIPYGKQDLCPMCGSESYGKTHYYKGQKGDWTRAEFHGKFCRNCGYGKPTWVHL